MTYDEYIAYHRQGDAGAEERMIASLCRHFSLSAWDSFRLIYYYTMTYHIPSALAMLLDGERDMKHLKFRTDRRYVRCNGAYSRLLKELTQDKYRRLCSVSTTQEAYNEVKGWFFFGRYAAYLFLEVYCNVFKPQWTDDVKYGWESDENYTKGAISVVKSKEKIELDRFLERAKKDANDNAFAIETSLCAVAKFNKGTRWTQDERYMELVRGQKNWNFKFSIITLDEAKARRIERGVPSPLARLEAIEAIANADAGGATLRLRPFIIGVSTPTYLDLIREACNRGATALSTEFFCVERRSQTLKEWMPVFNELCGFDLMQFYIKYSVSQGYLRLNRKVKAPFIRNMHALCKELGMRFYVSDAHFKELCCNGSCCGLPADWNYSKGQFCEALQIAKAKGSVRWDDIKADIESLHQYDWGRAVGFNANSSEKRAQFYGMSMAEYMRWLWNNPQAGQSPYKMFEGVMQPSGKDENGNIIYTYNKERTL